MLVRVVVAIALLLLPSTAFAQAEKRIALLIGNKDYKPGVGSLTNPLNDIHIVGDALKSVGFEVLKPIENAQRSAMLVAIYAFAAKLKAAGPDAVGFLYYSGHGIASAGENYLIPIDVDEPSTVQLSVQGVKQSEVLSILRGEAPNAAHYLVLDACRNTLQGARGGKGFVPVGQQSGVLVAFATEPGKTASDIGKGSGPYAAALATELVKPGQSDLIMFHNVRVAVIEKTKGDQVPWTEDGIQRPQRLLFAGDASSAAEAWRAVKDTKSISALETYIAHYKDYSFYADLARSQIESLRAEALENRKIQTALAPAPKLTPNTPVGPFDGIWDANVKGDSGCIYKSYKFPLMIEGTKITSAKKVRPGRVTPDGNFEFYMPSSVLAADIGTFTGKLSGHSGSGSFKWHSGRCTGSFTLRRQ